MPTMFSSLSFVFFIMTRAQVLDTLSAFPPAEGMAKMLMDFDYKKAFNNYMDAIEMIVKFIMVVVAIAGDIAWFWYHNGGKEFLIETRQNAVVAFNNARQHTYNAGVQSRRIYEVISSPLFITL